MEQKPQKSKKSRKLVHTLTPEQLQKKRNIDRAAQQKKRYKAKRAIEELEKTVYDLKSYISNLTVERDFYRNLTMPGLPSEEAVLESTDVISLPHSVTDTNATTTYDEQSMAYTTSPGSDQTRSSLQIFIRQSANREQSQDQPQPNMYNTFSLPARAMTQVSYFSAENSSVSGHGFFRQEG